SQSVFLSHVPLRALPSFPTRRSSDLGTYDSSSVGALTATGFFYADAPRATLAVGKPGFPAPRQPRLLDRVREVLRARHSSRRTRSEEHTSELQSRFDLVCRLLLEKKK